MMTTTLYALLPPPDDGGRWVRLVAAHAEATQPPHQGLYARLESPPSAEDTAVIAEAEDYFEEVGWPHADGSRMVAISLGGPELDAEAAAESFTVKVADIPKGTVSLLITNSR
ncbi:hypothetical protein ACH4RG_23085 [Streptomyces sp. NPDC021019]|uniref:hypothetical protein n=1 Tax=Streptomyces sp. NPDC021019 TaxID=3365108 RepID=UPI0037901DF2